MHLRLTEAEAARVTKAAKKAGFVTVSNFLRALVVQALS
jgi:hypothetical protein